MKFGTCNVRDCTGLVHWNHHQVKWQNKNYIYAGGYHTQHRSESLEGKVLLIRPRRRWEDITIILGKYGIRRWSSWWGSMTGLCANGTEAWGSLRTVSLTNWASINLPGNRVQNGAELWYCTGWKYRSLKQDKQLLTRCLPLAAWYRVRCEEEKHWTGNHTGFSRREQQQQLRQHTDLACTVYKETEGADMGEIYTVHRSWVDWSLRDVNVLSAVRGNTEHAGGRKTSYWSAIRSRSDS
jgi:hypothetical protein